MRKPPTLLVRKIGHALHPADPVTDDYFDEIPKGKEFHVKFWVPRSPKFHRTAMAYFKNVTENQDRFDTIEDLTTWLKIRTGMFTIFQGHDGVVYRLADSLDFASMDEVHFRRFMRRAEYLIATELLPDYDLERSINEFKAESMKLAAQYEYHEGGE